MTKIEINSGPDTVEYQEPDPALFRRVLLTDHLGREALHGKGYRIKEIDEDGVVVFEPHQEGAKRYPPLRVPPPPQTSSPGNIHRLTP